jgi:hypothetical protein
MERIREALQPFLALDLLAWQGLPVLPAALLHAALGEPERSEEAALGWYPAQCLTYPRESPSGGLNAYVREGEVVLVEALAPPAVSVLEALGKPDAVLPHEILSPGAYVYEFLYGERGLILSVAEPLAKEQPRQILRCRGIRPLAAPFTLGPELYLPFEDQTSW